MKNRDVKILPKNELMKIFENKVLFSTIASLFGGNSSPHAKLLELYLSENDYTENFWRFSVSSKKQLFAKLFIRKVSHPKDNLESFKLAIKTILDLSVLETPLNCYGCSIEIDLISGTAVKSETTIQL